MLSGKINTYYRLIFSYQLASKKVGVILMKTQIYVNSEQYYLEYVDSNICIKRAAKLKTILNYAKKHGYEIVNMADFQ